MTDRYELSREFNLQAFEMEIMRCNDLYKLQELCVRLYATTQSQRVVYERLLRDRLDQT